MPCRYGVCDLPQHKQESRGAVCISISIWPKARADAQPVGAGRDAPNHSPYLPPPVGRISFSWNPFVLGSELLGPVLCAKLTCCLTCAIFLVLLFTCQPLLNLIIGIVISILNH